MELSAEVESQLDDWHKAFSDPSWTLSLAEAVEIEVKIGVDEEDFKVYLETTKMQSERQVTARTANENDPSSAVSKTSRTKGVFDNHIENTPQTTKPSPSSRSSNHTNQSNEALLHGFAILRMMQLLNFDIHYIRIGSDSEANSSNRTESKLRLTESSAAGEMSLQGRKSVDYNGRDRSNEPVRTIFDDLMGTGFFIELSNRWWLLGSLLVYLKICLSLLAIMFSVDKTLSTILLCLMSRIDLKSTDMREVSDSSLGWTVLILVNLSSLYIIVSLIFNGHILWDLLSRKLFLVERSYQYKVMLSLIAFVYLEYIINVAFINNLYDWNLNSGGTLNNGYSVLASLKRLVTEQDEQNYYIDTLLTVIQFSRGIIRISPYITINYVMICLKRHINAIRNQSLLTDSLKKRQKLRLVVTNRKTNLPRRQLNGDLESMKKSSTDIGRKKRVLFAKEMVQKRDTADNNMSSLVEPTLKNEPEQSEDSRRALAPLQTGSGNLGDRSISALIDQKSTAPAAVSTNSSTSSPIATSRIRHKSHRNALLEIIRNFEELESYITNLYIFTESINRVMSKQGLAVFFIIHNLVISCALILPEPIKGGIFMAHFIRALLIIMGLTPFFLGQSLSYELEELSKQIDRIIIQQQFTKFRRDNLVCIRELLHEIQINCGGMLNFNIETGVKYLVVAFASAFFIEQEDYKLTRRH